ncbi:MAG: DUF3107 domain-containing protein [Nocardioides sp.]|uniref:DUF3107 domain-containing protein n=1 Tax=Nocardioides sp. TaxID=35761 RepID=UPI003F02A75A
MELKIGIQNAPRELLVETDEAPEDVTKRLTKALSDDGVFTVTDTKGRTVLVPAARLAYVEIGGGVVGTVGFR